MQQFFYNLYYLALDASYWLVIGLFIGGLFKTLIPTALLQKHLSADGFVSVIKAAILGAPLPLCSCGVIPAAMGLREAGASKSATTSFLVSTPETGVDSVFITYAMMGPFMALARPVTALLSAITTGTLVTIFDNDGATKLSKPEIQSSSCCASKAEPKVEESCCSSQKVPAKTDSCCSTEKSQAQQNESCCSSSQQKEAATGSLLNKIINGVNYAFTDLLDNIILWLVIGMVFAALVQTFVPSDMLIKYGSGLIGMLVMLVVGIPMYVCATASTPLAAGFLMAGISPGAVLVFLLAGPATNMATLGIINQQMGKKTMFLYLLGIMLTALISGFVVNWLVLNWNININQYLAQGHQHTSVWLQLLALLLLTTLSLRRFFVKA